MQFQALWLVVYFIPSNIKDPARSLNLVGDLDTFWTHSDCLRNIKDMGLMPILDFSKIEGIFHLLIYHIITTFHKHIVIYLWNISVMNLPVGGLTQLWKLPEHSQFANDLVI